MGRGNLQRNRPRALLLVRGRPTNATRDCFADPRLRGEAATHDARAASFTGVILGLVPRTHVSFCSGGWWQPRPQLRHRRSSIPSFRACWPMDPRYKPEDDIAGGFNARASANGGRLSFVCAFQLSFAGRWRLRLRGAGRQRRRSSATGLFCLRVPTLVPRAGRNAPAPTGRRATASANGGRLRGAESPFASNKERTGREGRVRALRKKTASLLSGPRSTDCQVSAPPLL